MDHHEASLGNLRLARGTIENYEGDPTTKSADRLQLDAVGRIGAAIVHALLAVADEIRRFHDDLDSYMNVRREND